MSFLSKVWKGVKSTFKSIGKGIKKAVKSVGKFMNKIGIVGQIALMFILPGVGAAIGGAIGTGVTAMAGSANALVSGVGKVLQVAGKFAHTVGNAYKTVTDGIASFVSNVGKGFVNSTAKMLGAKAPVIGGPESLSKGFQEWMGGVAEDVGNITSPFKVPATEVATTIEAAYEKSMTDPESLLAESEKLFKQSNDDFRFYEVPKEKYAQIAKAEQGAFKKFVGGTVDYAKETAKAMPQRAIDAAANSITGGVATKTAQAVGLEDKPEYNVTNISNPIPQFSSTPLTARYETAGLNYGALPDNRIQYFAAQNTGFGDYGMSAFKRFSPVGA